MARNRAVDFLPEIFKTDTNKEFLSSTLDQLTQRPKLKQAQGFVGRKFGEGIESDDSYIIEPTAERTHYQLEPGIVFNDDENNAESAITYPELIDALKTKGADVSKHDRLFSSPIYSWSPLIDFDKFVNHSQYYWLPSGPDSVDVSSTDILLTDNFDVTRNTSNYNLSGISGTNPTITLVRGGEYTFSINQPTHNFYIQTELRTSGTLSHSPNISSRDVLGVSNNGEDSGIVSFAVPETNRQQFYYDLPEITAIDLVTSSRFDAINGKLLSQLENIDGISDLEGKTIVFLDTTAGNSADLGWQYLNLHEDAPFEVEPFEETSFIDSQSDRYSVYQIEYVKTTVYTTYDTLVSDEYDTTNYDSEPYSYNRTKEQISKSESIIKLNRIKTVDNLEKFTVLYGDIYSNKSFYKNSSGFFQEVPLLSAAHDTLYYQDATDENKFGIINLIDSTNDAVLNINDAIGKQTYTSPNGVIFTNGLKVIFRGNVNPSAYRDREYYIEGVGTSIKLIASTDLVTPEQYTTSELEPFDYNGFDSTNFDGNLSSPTVLDFITINRASNDLNPWSRSNRWVHKDVIERTAEYNNITATFDNNFRANRPIIEFDANLKLFNFGTESKVPVTVIDFNEEDALSNINGATGFSIDGITITEGARVIFAKDLDINVRNNVYEVHFIELIEGGVLTVNLLPASDSNVAVNQNIVCLNGDTLQGKAFHFNGVDWIRSQQKTTVNQPPLFDVFDIDGLSLEDATVYPKSTFIGTKLFSYAIGTGPKDPILGFPLTFLNIDNLGDIVFNNDLYKDTFTHSVPAISAKISKGYIRKYTDRTIFNNELGWTKFAHNTTSSQIFDFDYNGTSLILDILPKADLSIPAIKVYIENKFINPSKYTITTEVAKTVIEFTNTVATNSEVKVTIISDTDSRIGYYSIPRNLENNPFNENSNTLTLGTIRNHYGELAQNLLELSGEINGTNNSRDLGNIEQYGDTIIQNSSPVAPMAKFLHSQEFNFFDALEFNTNEYEKFKLKIVDYVIKKDTYNLTASTVLDHALESINVGKSVTSPFYKSDMLAGVYTPSITVHTVSSISTSTFNIINIYDFTKANNIGILVYLNNAILIKDDEYNVSTDSSTIDILVSLKVGDVIVVKEFESTLGSYVPNTPTKVGLYPKFKPRKYLDNTFTVATNVIQGHDGSITVAWNDIRDDVLLEFESRIFNNIKIASDVPIRNVDVIPGKFRSTEYTDAETTNILSNSFLNWVGWNRLDYKTQDFLADNEQTWNYSTCSSKLDGSALKGHWRGVYKHYYDTDTPHTTPWEMIGFSEKPSWWELEYGATPYTSGNLVLWDDLEAGLIKEPGNNRVDVRYKRTNLTTVIPVDSEGKLLNPFVSMVKNYSQSDFRKSWVIGDCGPTETAWRRSSSYPFALQRLFALTKPAQYFALSIDRDRYAFNNNMSQYLYDSRYRIDVRAVEIQSNTQPKHSYINWIADYHNNNGCSCIDITDQLSKVDVRLCYRMASFTDKNYLKIFTDKSSPDSSNTGLLLPDQSYDLILHKNHALFELQYSSVVVQKTIDGYSVHGHSNTQQYFEILQSVSNNNSVIIDGEINLPKDFIGKVTLVPYGYVFTNKDSVIDFLASYGAFLESHGMVFESKENTTTLTWGRMAQEFLAWSAQGWGTGSIVNLNPSAISLEFNKELTIVDNINNSNVQVLDQNSIPLEPSDYVITRLDNNFKITAINNKSINFLKIKSTSYEHLLVIDNVSIFNDLLYKPVTGLRQQRVRLVGFTTFEWNGQLDAQGFILNQDNIKDWRVNEFYTTGNIVKFKSNYWSAISKLEPAETFNFNDWAKINYNDINKGLLPNITNKADQITEYYNKKTTNLESDVDLLAMGLTGFRPRSYLDSLDDVSQVSFYSGFIAGKGTANSANVFRNVKFDKKITDYEIFENWAVREAIYGNSSNRTFIDLELDSTRLQNNPSIVEIVATDTIEDLTHQSIKLNEVYNQNKTPTTKNVFPVRSSKLTDTNLPIAGHVHTSDVDIALYEITDLNGVPGIPFMTKLSSGSLVWVAKDTAYDWNIYRTDIQSNISSILPVEEAIEVTFFHDHDFVVNDKLIIQGINILVNGAYVVENVIDSKVVRLSGSVGDAFVNIAADSSITADTELYKTDHKLGFVYKLTSVRIENKAGLTTEYIDRLPIGSRVWVDINENNKHSVYQKYKVQGNVTADTSLTKADSDIISTDGDGAWGLLREEQSVVDTSLINRALIYDKSTNQTTQNLDYIDPINGKILGIANENIDYKGAIDPAAYNQHTVVSGVIWGEAHIGKIWWDTANVKFIDCNQTDLTYASKNWGNLFPGSTIDIRQWVKSSVHPSQYSGPGSVVELESYTTVSSIDNSNTIIQSYYFWITDSTEVSTNKTLSVNGIKQYIEMPSNSGVPFIAFLNDSTVALYNSHKHIDNAVLHISYNQVHNENDVFSEYSLIKENNKNDFLSDSVYRKLQDSFVGGNAIGLSVPDYKLNAAQKTGIDYRPRQSMFNNRFEALKEYLTQANAILKKHIITTNKNFGLLSVAEKAPGLSSGKWDIQVHDLAELNYQNLDIVAVGYKYLVNIDTNYNSGWSIYEVITGPQLQLVQVQQYDTMRAWEYINWYETDIVEQAIVQQVVADSSLLSILTVVDGTYAKVLSNSNGKFEIYQLRNGFWVHVGLEDGTIKFKSSLWSGNSTYDNITCDTDAFTVDSIISSADIGTGGTELRNIIRALNEDLLVDDLLIERNKLLISMFNYVLSEQGNVDWLYKTSLIDVEHKVRDLEQYATYKKDDQDFFLNYLNESKPYHTKIKEFLLKYNGSDQYNTDLADFDVPAYYDESFSKFISPVLDSNETILTTSQSNFDDEGVGLTDPDYNIWELSPWDSWYNNRSLTIKSATITNNGSGYTQVPLVTVSGGGALTQATMIAKINNSGQLIEVAIKTEGSGYITTPVITISGGTGLGATVTPVMQNALVRNLNTTLKYNRCEYNSSVVDWISNTMLSTTSDTNIIRTDNAALNVDSADSIYESGQLVRYKDKLYTHKVTRAFKTIFSLDDFTEVNPGELSAANRTMGFYTPGVNNLGLDLALLIHGIDYPGAKVTGLDFNNSAGFSVLGFDTEPFDVINVDEDGSVSYSEGVLDIKYSSAFNNTYLGTAPSDINVKGGEFIDTYSSHSPEELVPSSMFDTLDLVVNTRPGFDYDGNGHAFEMQYKLFDYTPSSTEFNFNNIVDYPIAIKVVNSSDGLVLTETTNYTIDWVNATVNIVTGAIDGNVIQLFVYEIGGGNQLFKTAYTGEEVGSTITVPVDAKSIYNIVVHVNGTELVTGFTATSDSSITVDSVLETADASITVDTVSTSMSKTTTIDFTTTYTSTDFITITIFGFESIQYDHCYPMTKVFTPFGADSTIYKADSTSITVDNVSTNFELGSGVNGTEKSISVINKNKQNAIVEHNGIRLRPPEAIRHIADGVKTNFMLPTSGRIKHSLISNSEVVVYVNNEVKTLNTDYIIITLTADNDTITADTTDITASAAVITADSSSTTVDSSLFSADTNTLYRGFKQVAFIDTAPLDNSKVDVYVITKADYTINETVLNIKDSISVSATDTVSITTWNDTSQLDILTSIFVGPALITESVTELFDSAGFDIELFDSIASEGNNVNLFELGRTVVNNNRLWVTKNGRLLLAGNDYLISNSTLLLTGDLLNEVDVIVVTSMTDDVVPEELSFRLFKDMNGSSAMYRIDNSVYLTADLLLTDEMIYVNDVSTLTIPNLELGTFGIVTINGERITYREINTSDNTISGLRRGTAGTAINVHAVNMIVNDIGIGNIVSGSAITSTTLGTDTSLVTMTQDKVWYATGNNTPSNGVALQNQVTAQANFIKVK